MDLKREYQDINVKYVDAIMLKARPHGYPIEGKREALRYYLEGIGFRRIERLLGVRHTAVIYWVKKAGEKIKDIAFEGRKTEKVDVLELDEMCVNFKKNSTKNGYGWQWRKFLKIYKGQT